MSIFFKPFGPYSNYGPQIDQARGENRLSHIINKFIPTLGKKEK